MMDLPVSRDLTPDEIKYMNDNDPLERVFFARENRKRAVESHSANWLRSSQKTLHEALEAFWKEVHRED